MPNWRLPSSHSFTYKSYDMWVDDQKHLAYISVTFYFVIDAKPKSYVFSVRHFTMCTRFRRIFSEYVIPLQKICFHFRQRCKHSVSSINLMSSTFIVSHTIWTWLSLQTGLKSHVILSDKSHLHFFYWRKSILIDQSGDTLHWGTSLPKELPLYPIESYRL